MKRNPVIPYAIIAFVAILAVIIISFVGINQREAIQKAEEEGGQTEEQAQEGEATGDPEAIFESNCAACHGADLTGGAGPDLTKVGSTLSADDIADIIKNGKGAMPAQSQVSAEDTEALAKWLSEKK